MTLSVKLDLDKGQDEPPCQISRSKVIQLQSCHDIQTQTDWTSCLTWTTKVVSTW